MREPWTPDEVAAIIEDYCEMLVLQAEGTHFNKMDRLRKLQAKLTHRSGASIARKYGNVSAAFQGLGLPTVTGYAPLANMQKSLPEHVRAFLHAHPDLEAELHGVGRLSLMANPFADDTAQSGLIVSPGMACRTMASLLAKRFLLLTGLSGSGKTKLALALATWMGGSTEREAGGVKGGWEPYRSATWFKLGYVPGDLRKRPDWGDAMLRELQTRVLATGLVPVGWLDPEAVQKENASPQVARLQSLKEGDVMVVYGGAPYVLLGVGTVQESPVYDDDAYEHFWRSTHGFVRVNWLVKGPFNARNLRLPGNAKQGFAGYQPTICDIDPLAAKAFIQYCTARGVLPAAGTNACATRYALIPVGANWTGKEDILGYPDALDAESYVTKPALELLLRADQDPGQPYFLILDEMNLSHVERYFADFLSAMESGEAIVLHDGPGEFRNADGELPVPRRVKRLPANLFVIGTVNVDETTYMFSPKVLDRANVIEFRAEHEAITGFLQDPQDVRLEMIAGKGAEFAAEFVTAAQQPTALGEPAAGWLRTELDLLFQVLADHEAEFGFRTAKDVARFVHYYLELSREGNRRDEARLPHSGQQTPDSGLGTPDSELFRQAMDAVVMQKILPKLHGSERKLGPILRALGLFCYLPDSDLERLGKARQAAGNKVKVAGNPLEDGVEAVFGELARRSGKYMARYPLSFEKIVRLLRKLKRDGFASFAEA